MNPIQPARVANPQATPGGQPVQLPALTPVQTQGLTRAAASGNLATFMQIAQRSGLNTEQALAFLQQVAQNNPAAARNPRFMQVAQAVNQRAQAERQQQTPPGEQPPGGPQAPGQQQGNFDIFKIPILGGIFATIAALFGQGPLASTPPTQQAARPQTQPQRS